MSDKMVTIYIDGYPRFVEENRLKEVLENIENLKKHYTDKGVSKEMIDKLYSVEIVWEKE